MKRKNLLTLFACALALLCLTGCATRTTPETSAADGATEQTASGAEASETVSVNPDASGVETSETVSVNPNASGAGASETVSVNPKDYGITDAMLSGEESANFPQLSIEALGAYCLYADGAMSESSTEELYQRFMGDPDAVLNYLVKLGGQSSRDGDTASAALCRMIAYNDAFGYDATPEFSAILQARRETNPSGPVSDLLECLQAEHDAALERNPN